MTNPANSIWSPKCSSEQDGGCTDVDDVTILVHSNHVIAWGASWSEWSSRSDTTQQIVPMYTSDYFYKWHLHVQFLTKVHQNKYREIKKSTTQRKNSSGIYMGSYYWLSRFSLVTCWHFNLSATLQALISAQYLKESFFFFSIFFLFFF